MPLAPGERIGIFEILAPIGKGGMGEVYRARDTKLKREVALKILPDAFAQDPARMARFQREAEVLASLNHPNIAHIYGVEERALAMELVEGESPQGPMPFEEAWKIALQIADALEYAHERGVIHRDLKPANVKVTPEGVVKLLDFGLAKAFSAELTSASPGASLPDSPTVTLGATVAGTILGTAAYMSPEQARGKNVDKRADIWSWGVVLYELLTGERMFQGEDAAETLAAVIHKQPELEKAPVQVRKLLGRCLERDPKRRLRDIGEARFLLSEESAPVVQTVPPQSRLIEALAATAGLLGLIAVATGWIAWRATRPPEPKPLVRLDVDLGPDVSQPPPSNGGGSVILSPDGTRLAYVASVAGGPQRLYTRTLDQTMATALPGTDGAQSPLFSPDGQWIAFAASGRLNKISVQGGIVVPLASIRNFAGGSWPSDGSLIGAEAFGRGLLEIPSGGGSATVLLPPGTGEVALAYPQLLPGGKALLFTSYTGAGAVTANIEVLRLADHQRKILVPGGVSHRYLPSSDHAGHLIYTNESTLFAAPFDLDTLTTRSAGVPVLDDVAFTSDGSNAAQFAVSASGALVYRKAASGAASGSVTIQWVDKGGKGQPVLSKPGAYRHPRLSPDGKRMAFDLLEGSGRDIVVYDLQREIPTKLTFGGQTFQGPVWSNDGHFVIFASPGNGIFWARSDGGGQPQQLTSAKAVQVPYSISHDGKRLAYFEINGAPQIWTVSLETEGDHLKAGNPEQFRKSRFPETDPVFSPDGRWLAYVEGSVNSAEVYVRAYPDNGSQWQISSNGGTLPVWSPNGRDLLYESGGKLMAAGYSVKGDAFVQEKPRVWIDKFGGSDWDLDPRGDRAVALVPVDAPEAPKADHDIVLLQNFLDYLRQRVPLPK